MPSATDVAINENGRSSALSVDANKNLKTTLKTAIAGEDLTNDVLVTENRYAYDRATADKLIVSGSGILHTISFAATGAVTAGVVTIYDNTAESGTVIWSGIIQATTSPISVLLDVEYTTGLYVGYDGTIANVATHVSYVGRVLD